MPSFAGAAGGGFVAELSEDVGGVADDGGLRDAVFQVAGVLLFSAAAGLVHRAFHRVGDPVGIEKRAGLRVASGQPDGLHEGVLET